MKGKIIVVVHALAEDLELWYPIYRLREEGYIVELAGEFANVEYHGKYGVPYTSDLSWNDVKASDYLAILIPGGWAPDKIRRFDAVKKLVRDFDENKKPIGQICHAGWVTISAGILKNRKVTSTPGIKDDMLNAGAIWIDKSVVVDNNLVSSRWPKDLPDYMVEFIKVLNKK